MVDFYPPKFRFVVWGSTLSNIQESAYTVKRCLVASKREMTTSEISECIEFKYVLYMCHLIHLDPLMANSNSTIDFLDKVTRGLRLEDCNIQIKFERMKRIMYSVRCYSKLFPNIRWHALTTLTVINQLDLEETHAINGILLLKYRKYLTATEF